MTTPHPLASFSPRQHLLCWNPDHPCQTPEFTKRVWEFLHDPAVGTRVRFFPRGMGYPPIDEAWMPAAALPERAEEERLWRRDWKPTTVGATVLVPVWDWEILHVDEARRGWDGLVGSGEWVAAGGVPHMGRAWGPHAPDAIRNSNGKVHCPQGFYTALCRTFGTVVVDGKRVPNIPQSVDTHRVTPFVGMSYALEA